MQTHRPASTHPVPPSRSFNTGAEITLDSCSRSTFTAMRPRSSPTFHQGARTPKPRPPLLIDAAAPCVPSRNATAATTPLRHAPFAPPGQSSPLRHGRATPPPSRPSRTPQMLHLDFKKLPRSVFPALVPRRAGFRHGPAAAVDQFFEQLLAADHLRALLTLCTRSQEHHEPTRGIQTLGGPPHRTPSAKPILRYRRSSPPPFQHCSSGRPAPR